MYPNTTPARQPERMMHATPQQQQVQEQSACSSSQRSGPCHTPKECATMVEAVEQAMQHVQQECTPESNPARTVRADNLQNWLQTSGMQMPTPAAKDLQVLVEAAADNPRLRRQLEALREAELELAAREAEETALGFSMLEEENMDLVCRNAQLQQRIAELEALAAAAEAAAQAQQAASPEPSTPQHQRMRALGLGGDGEAPASVQERATSVLKRAAAASRLSGLYEEEQQAKLRQLSEAEGRLSAMKSQAPGSTQSQHTAMQQRLTVAEEQVQEAAAAAREATVRLQALQNEKEEVQGELAALRQQLEAQPNAAAQHAELYEKLLEAQQQLLQEKQASQQLAGSLLEHAGRLSHRYYNLSDDYDVLEHRYHELNRTNEHLASQLWEAHEALYDAQTAVQATPVHRRKEQQHLVSRLQEAEQAVMSLAQEKQQLQERLLQAHAFISCLQQRPDTAATTTATAVAPLQTPTGAAATPAAVTPNFGAAVEQAVALPEAGAADTPAQRSMLQGVVPAASLTSDRQQPLPATQQQGDALASEPMSPILAAAARSKTVGEQRSAASHELQDVQQEQMGLRQEINRAKSALADIAVQLRASIGAAATAPGTPTHSASSSVVSGGASCSSAAPQGRRPTAAPAASASRSGNSGSGSSSGQSRGTVSTRTSGGSKGASAGRNQGPPKLLELHKAAAAVKSASAARSSGSSSRTGSVASKGTSRPDFTFSSVPGPAAAAAAATGALPGEFSRSRQQWDRLGKAGGSSAAGDSRGAALSVPAAPASRTPSVSAGAAGSAGIGHVRTAACLSAASGSGKGSISLDQLIADAESVSLEYGISPWGCPAGTAAAARNAAAVAAGAVVRQLPTPIGSAAGSSCASAEAGGRSRSTPLQQGAKQFAFLTSGQVGGTPGSAASSAGAAAGPRVQQGRHQLNQQQQWEMTPASVADAGLQLEDMQSCMRPAAGSKMPAAATAARQQGTPAAATPVGLERVASNPLLGQLDDVTAASVQVAKQLARALAASGVTPTNLGGVRAAGEGADSSSVQLQLAGAPDTSACVASTAAAEARGLTERSSQASGAGSPVECSMAAAGAADPPAHSFSAEVQQQGWQQGWQQQQQEVTPVKAPSAAEAAPAAAPKIASPPSALKKAAAALLSSISPAGLLIATSPAAALGTQATPTAATAAFAAGMSPQLLSHLTPEWLRSLKRKCKQESEQLQQLRRQMGLATPEDQLPAAQQQQGSIHTSAAAAGVDTGAAASTGAAVEGSPAATPQMPGAGSSPADSLPAPSVVSGEIVPPSASAAPARSASGTRAVAGASHPGASSLGQLSSRSSIGRLRRRAMMAHATAAAVEDADAAAPTPDGAPDFMAAAAAAGILGGSKAPVRSPADTACLDDQLDRTSSAGSLADYMRGSGSGSGRRDDASVPVSRTSSITPGLLPARPGCPTPGSTYSDVNDALSSADNALSGRDTPVSPDMLLVGLRSSRLAARQLQHALMAQLEKTNSMPSILSRQHEAALGYVQGATPGSSSLPRTSSAAAAIAAAAAAAVPVSDAGDGGSSYCGSPALEASTELLAVPPQGGLQQQQQQHTQLSRLLGEQGAAGSTGTPGAALNAGAESRLLSPGTQLQLVFDSQDSQEDDGAAAGQQQQLEEAEEEVPGVGSVSSTCSRSKQQHQEQSASLTSLQAAGSPMVSTDSSCMLPLGLAAKAQPGADSAVAAPSPPASVMTATPGYSGVQGSVKAGPLSVSAGTLTASAVTPLSTGLQGRAPGSIQVASSSESGTQASSSRGGPSLGSWQEGGAAASTPASAAGSVSKQVPAHSATSAGDPGSLQDCRQEQQESLSGAAGLPIMLGDSPSSKPQHQQQQAASSCSVSAASASRVWGASAATLGSASEASDSCMSSSTRSPGPQLTLGDSPGSAQVAAPGLAAGALPQTAPAEAPVAAPTSARSPATEALMESAAAAGKPAVDPAAAAAAIAAAFAVAKKPAAASTAATPAAAAATVAAAPAASATTWGSCMFATPAAAFNSPGGTYSAVSDGSDGQYYTGLQDSSLSSRVVSATAASMRHVATTDSAGLAAVAAQSETAADAVAAANGAVFAGFSLLTGVDAAEAPASPAIGLAAPGVATAAAGPASAGPSAAGGGAGNVTATAQKRMLQELLGSPSDDSEPSEDSSLSPASASHFQQQAADVGLHEAASLGAVQELEQPAAVTGPTPACCSPARSNAGVSVGGQTHQQQQQQVVSSPTLSELGFVAASASADVAAAKRLQQQQQEEAAGRGRGADLDGLSFQQRLELLCADEEEDGEEVVVGTGAASTPGNGRVTRTEQCSTSPRRAESPAGTATAQPSAAAASAASWQLDAVHVESSAGVQGAGVACCATQTSPYSLAYASAGDQGPARFKEAGVQVPTPVHHGVQSKQHEAAAQGSGKPCDVAASPTKVRDQC